jgi:hypothetical protein
MENTLVLLNEPPFTWVPTETPDICNQYWRLLSAVPFSEEFNTALCKKQSHFKKWLKLLDPEGHILEDIKTRVCFSKSRFPTFYPCKVQVWHHMEGNIFYVDFKELTK